MTRRRAWLASAVAVLAVAVALVLLLLATESGTRWLWAKAESSLPPQLSVANVGGTLLSAVTVEGIRWRDDGIGVVVESARVEIGLARLFSRTVQIDDLQIRGVDIETEPAAESDSPGAPPSVRLPFTLQIDRAEIEAIAVRLANATERDIRRIGFSATWVDSNLSVTGLGLDSDWLALSTSGEFDLEPPYAVSASGSWRLLTAEWRNPSGEFGIEGTTEEYVVEHQLLSPVRVASDLRLTDALAVWRAEVDNRWEEVSLALEDGAVVRSSGGALSFGISAGAYDLSGTFDLGADNFDLIPISVAAAGTPDILTLERFSSRLPFGDLDAAGRVNIGELSWSMSIAIDNGDLSAVTPELQGPFNATASLEGRVLDLDAGDGEIAVRDVTGQIGSFPLTGAFGATVTNRSLSRVAANVELGASSVKLDAVAAANVEGQLEFTVDDLSMIAGFGGGSVVGSATLSGPRDNPSLTFNAHGEDVALNGVTADDIQASFDGTVDEHAIAVRAARLEHTLEVTAAGGVAGEIWQGEVRDIVVADANGNRWTEDNTALLTVSPESLTIDRFCLTSDGNQGTLCAEVQRDPDASIHARFDARSLPLEMLSVALPERLEPSGTLGMEGDVRLQDGNVNGRVSLSIDDGLLSSSYGGETLSANFIGSATAEIADSRLRSTMAVTLDDLGQLDGDLQVSHVLEGNAALGGTFAADIEDISFLAILIPELQSPEGRVSGQFSLSGTRTEPRLLGELQLIDGRFGVAPAGIELDDVELRARQVSDGSLSLTGSAMSGDGRIELTGGLPGAGEADGNAWLEIRGERVELLRLSEQKVTASPDLTIAFTPNRATITGTVVVPSADITADALPEGAARPSADVVVHRESGSSAAESRAIVLDVAVVLEDDVRVSGYGLATRVEGALDVSGSNQRAYLGTGRLELHDGEYEAFGQTLTIQRGELVFNGPLTAPQLNIRAVRDAGEVTAGVHLTGTPNDLRSSVFSDPAMGDADALSYLLTGRPLSGASSSEGDTLNQAAFALGLSRAGAVTEQIRGTLGLETLAVEGGADSSRIVAGKRLGGRLFVEYGYGLIDQLGTLLLRFQINDRLVVETSSGSATTLDLVYSVKKD